jgi:hypothetical protein
VKELSVMAFGNHFDSKQKKAEPEDIEPGPFESRAETVV